MSRIIVACKNNTEYINLVSSLNKNDYSVFARAVTSFELLNYVKVNDPSIVIIYGKLDSNLHYIGNIIEFHNCPVVVIDKELQKANYYNYHSSSMFHFIDEIGFEGLINTIIDMMIKVRKNIKVLSKELSNLKTQNETIKIVDQAKFYLMETKNITESEAHKLISKLSMDNRIPKSSVAKKILKQNVKC